MEIEREVVDLYRAVMMRDRMGERYEGTVTALVGSGIFVQLDAPFVDVLVRLEDLGADRWELDEEKMRVIASRSGDSIGLGDKLIVEIVDVQILRRTVYGKRIGGGQSERGAGDRSNKKPKFPIYEKKADDKRGGPHENERQVRAGKRKVDKHASKSKGGRKGGKGGRRG